jgi:hypothetical protein
VKALSPAQPETSRLTVARSLLLAGAAATVILAAGLSRIHPSWAWKRAPAARPALSAIIGSAPARVPGHQRKFELVLETELASARAPVTVNVRGTWNETVASVHAGHGSAPGNFDVAYLLEDPHVTGGGVAGVSDKALQGLTRQLGQRFYVTYDASGAATRAYFPKDVEPSVRNLLEFVVTGSQLVWPRASAPEWRTTERDGAGTYWASYRRVSAHEVSKRKLQYVDLDGASGLAGANAFRVTVDASETRFGVDDTGNVASLDMSETTRLDFQMPGSALGMKFSLHLANARAGDAPDAIGSLEHHRADLESTPIQTARTDAKALQTEEDERIVSGMSTEEVLSGARAPKPEDVAMLRLESLLRLRPSVVPEVVRLVRHGENAARFATLLGAAGNADSQSALVALAHEIALNEETRIAALSALARVQHPAAVTAAGLRDLNEVTDAALRRASQLMSGALARALGKDEPEAAAVIENDLAGHYRDARDERARLDLLAALGNAAGPAATRVLMEAAGDSNPHIRAAAVDGLRLCTDPRVDLLLSSAISDDEDSSVRSSAIFSVRFRSIAAFAEVLIHAAETDAVDSNRSAALSLLGAHREASPKINEALLFVAEHDAKPGLRRLAREIAARE